MQTEISVPKIGIGAILLFFGLIWSITSDHFKNKPPTQESTQPIYTKENTKREIVEITDSRRVITFGTNGWSELVKPPAGRFYISAVGTNVYHVRAFVNGVETKVVRINPLDPTPPGKKTKETFDGGVITFQFMSESSPTNAVVVEGVHYANGR